MDCPQIKSEMARSEMNKFGPARCSRAIPSASTGALTIPLPSRATNMISATRSRPQQWNRQPAPALAGTAVGIRARRRERRKDRVSVVLGLEPDTDSRQETQAARQASLEARKGPHDQSNHALGVGCDPQVRAHADVLARSVLLGLTRPRILTRSGGCGICFRHAAPHASPIDHDCILVERRHRRRRASRDASHAAAARRSAVCPGARA